MAVRPTYSYGEKSVNSYYVSLENMIASGVQMGNVADIWIEAPSKIIETTESISSINGVVNINNTSFSTPIQEIVDITDSSSTILSREDWDLSSNIGMAYSTDPEHQIILGGDYSGVNETFTITYRYYSDGPGIQALLESESLRVPGALNLVKIKPPHTLEFRILKLRGSISLEQMKQHIKDFVHNLSNTFELSDLYNYLYNNGIDFIDTDSTEFYVRGYDYKCLQTTNFLDPATSPYTIEGIGSFYVGTSDLDGVSKINE